MVSFVHLFKQPDFSLDTVSPGRCFITNVPKHKDEKFVVRCGNIDMERGWVEISPRGIQELAGFIGWIPPDKADELEAENALLKSKLSKAEEDADQSTLDTVIKLSRSLESAKKRAHRYGLRVAELEKKLGLETPKNRAIDGRNS